MHRAFGNSLMVEMSDFFPKDKVFKKGRPAQTGFQ